jgi:hypothetical protein
MSRQVDKKYPDLRKKFAKVLEITGYKKPGKFAIDCKISPGTLSKALARSSFSEDIVDKINDTFKVRKTYWDDGKEPIIEKNGTPAMNTAEQPVIREQKKDPAVDDRILKKLDSLTDNVNAFGDFNRFLLKEIDRLRKKITDLGGEI